jgi:hypothetical protein
MSLTLHEVLDAINDCPELRGNNRRGKVVSAMAEALAQEDEDEPHLETVLTAAADFEIPLTFTAVCQGCLTDCPISEQYCKRCATGLRSTTAEQGGGNVRAEFMSGPIAS